MVRTRSLRQLLAARLKELRLSRRFSQQTVAHAMGLHRPSYSVIELEIREVRLGELISLCLLYNTSLQELLGPALAVRFRIVRK